MKSTGVIRRIDELGRVVIPIDMRTQLGIEEKDPVEISLENSSIVLRKNIQKCIFCGNTKKLITFEDKLICEKCVNNISNIKRNHKQI